jgi:hypothetical protein
MTKQGDLIIGIKQVAKDHFAWPGGYPLFLIMADGEYLCATCTEKNLGLIVSNTVSQEDGQWQALAQVINWEDESLSCAHCNEPIEVAYPSA